jgi:hypothetical protein
MSIETTMTEMPEIWDQYDFQEKHFTIGNGKKPYHFWTWGAVWPLLRLPLYGKRTRRM